MGAQLHRSLFYPDQVTPRLSPAYDIVTTGIDNEKCYAFNLGKTKEWYEASYTNFQVWADRAGVPWRVIKPHIDDAMEKARSLWPTALKELPMNKKHKQRLKNYWSNLHENFQKK